MPEQIKQSCKLRRRTPEQTKFLLGLIDKYPLAFKLGEESYDARRKRVRCGGALLKTPEARRQRDLVCRECQLAGMGRTATANATGFPQTTVDAAFESWNKMEAI